MGTMEKKRKYTRKTPMPSHMTAIPASERRGNPGWSMPPALVSLIKEETERRNASLPDFQPPWTVSSVAEEYLTRGLRASGLME